MFPQHSAYLQQARSKYFTFSLKKKNKKNQRLINYRQRKWNGGKWWALLAHHARRPCLNSSLQLVWTFISPVGVGLRSWGYVACGRRDKHRWVLLAELWSVTGSSVGAQWFLSRSSQELSCCLSRCLAAWFSRNINLLLPRSDSALVRQS